MSLLTLAQATAHLHLTVPAGDPIEADVLLKLEQAEAIILNYLAERADPTWDAETVPKPVQSAVLLMLARLYAHRGDLEAEDDQLWMAIERLLRRLRNEAIA